MSKWVVLGFAAAIFCVAGCREEEPAEPPATGEQPPAAEAGEAKPGEAEAEAEPEEPAEVEPEQAEAEPEEEGHPVWPDVDLEAELELLQGTWKVRTAFGAKEDDTWTIEGDKLQITSPAGETTLARITLPQPGEIGVKEGGRTSYYAYARDGEDVWIGLGTGGVKTDEAWYVGEDRGVVVFDGEACRYHERKMGFGGGQRQFEEPVEVECEVQEGGGEAVLHYQTPRFMKEGERDDHQIQVVGRALLNEQLRKEHVAKRAE